MMTYEEAKHISKYNFSCSKKEYVSIWIPGEPVSKGRPRFYTSPKGKVITTTPGRTKTAEGVVRTFAIDAYNKELHSGPVRLRIYFGLQIPMSKSKKYQQSILNKPCLKKPDSDNMLKLIKDSLNGIIWKDDSQVFQTEIIKLWTHEPGTMIEIELIGAD